MLLESLCAFWVVKRFCFMCWLGCEVVLFYVLAVLYEVLFYMLGEL